MTYCLGWKTEGTVILAADSAITSTQVEPYFSETTFGEKCVYLKDGRIVQESAVKIYKFDKMIVTYTGTTKLSRQIMRILKQELDQGKDQLESLKMAIGCCVTLVQDDCKIMLIYTYQRDGDFVLGSFNANRDLQFLEHDSLIQLGSVPERLQWITSSYLASSLRYADRPFDKVAQLLGLLQSYSRLVGSSMCKGIGGVFAAAYIDISGTHWQPDFLHVAIDSDEKSLIGVFNTNGMIFVKSSLRRPGEQTICFLNVVDQLLDSVKIESMCAPLFVKYSTLLFKGKFDFVCIHNSKTSSAIVIKMLKKLKHHLVWFDPIFKNGKEGIYCVFNKGELKKFLSRKYIKQGGQVVPSVTYSDYIPPSDNNPIKKIWRRRRAVPFKVVGG